MSAPDSICWSRLAAMSGSMFLRSSSERLVTDLRGAGGLSSWATKYSRGSALHLPEVASRSLLSRAGGRSRLSVRRLGLVGGLFGNTKGSLKDSLLDPVILISLGGGGGAALLEAPTAPIWSPLTGPSWSTAFAPMEEGSLTGATLGPGGSLETLVKGAGGSKKVDFDPTASFPLLASVRYVDLEPVTSCESSDHL